MKKNPKLEIFNFKTIGSTNDYAIKLARAGAKELTVVRADIQTKGKGRFEREWVSPKGGIYFSLVLMPFNSGDKTLLLPLTFSKATALALKKYVDANSVRGKLSSDNCKISNGIKVKMPNDVMVNGKKIGGVLIETGTDSKEKKFLVAGIGININTKKEQLPDCATSLYVETGKSYNMEKIFNKLLKEIIISYEKFIS